MDNRGAQVHEAVLAALGFDPALFHLAADFHLAGAVSGGGGREFAAIQAREGDDELGAVALREGGEVAVGGVGGGVAAGGGGRDAHAVLVEVHHEHLVQTHAAPPPAPPAKHGSISTRPPVQANGSSRGEVMPTQAASLALTAAPQTHGALEARGATDARKRGAGGR